MLENLTEIHTTESTRPTPRFKPVYEVATGDGEVYHRNRRHFRRTNEHVVDSEADVQVQDDEEPLIVTGQCHPLEGLDRVEPRQDKDVQRTRVREEVLSCHNDLQTLK